MNSTRLNEWLQIAAGVGVIVGLVLVAYEIRISNRVGVEQANAVVVEKWDKVSELALQPGVAEFFVRAHE
jgi:hypothetical protein